MSYEMSAMSSSLMLVAVTVLVPYGKESEQLAANLLSSCLQYLNMNRRHVLVSDVGLGHKPKYGVYLFFPCMYIHTL